MPKTIRLNVEIDEETKEQLTRMKKEKNITFSEAVRRCVSIASFLQSESDSGNTIQIVNKEKNKVREMTIND